MAEEENIDEEPKEEINEGEEEKKRGRTSFR